MSTFLQAHKQLQLKAEAASKQHAAAAAAAPSSEATVAKASARQMELPGRLSPDDAVALASGDGGGGGGVLDMVGGTSGQYKPGDGSKSAPGGGGGGGGGGGAKTVAGMIEGAMGFFSPTSLARHRKLLVEEDERREASLDIMGESSQIIGALKTEVGGWLGEDGEGGEVMHDRSYSFSYAFFVAGIIGRLAMVE